MIYCGTPEFVPAGVTARCREPDGVKNRAATLDITTSAENP